VAGREAAQGALGLCEARETGCANSSHASWARDPIDAFVLARLEKEGLAPSPRASKETLIRRLSLDLIGLPQRLRK